MRAACYVRVSTSEQKNGLSIDHQIDVLTKYCKEHNYTIVGIYDDAGHSARKKYTHRPSLLRLIEDCKNDKVDIILFTKLDRWFRNVGDYYEIQSILDEHGVHWQTVLEDYETVTSTGRFKVNIMLSVNQAEAERTSERIKAICEYRKAQGKYVGKAPIGYKLVNSHLVKDPETQKAMEVFFESYFKNMSIAQALRDAKPYGLDYPYNQIRRTMKLPHYYGDAYGYKCEPYITEEQHKMMLRPKPRQNQTHNIYLFSHLCICGKCGKYMRGHTAIETRKNGNVWVYPYYSCPVDDYRVEHHNNKIGEAQLEKYLLSNLEEMWKGFKINVTAQSKQKGRDTLLKKKNSLQGKLERLKELFVDGDIPKNEYLQRKSALQAEIDSIIIEKQEVVKLPEDWHDLYNALDKPHKQMFWQRTIDKIVISETPQVFFKST